jgi:hypothetical protein
VQPVRPGLAGAAAGAEASAGYAGLEAGGRTVLPALQRRPTLQSPTAGAHSRADLR